MIYLALKRAVYIGISFVAMSSKIEIHLPA